MKNIAALRIFCVLCVLALLLSSCQNAPPADTTATPPAVSQPTDTRAPETPAPTPGPTAEPMPDPTEAPLSLSFNRVNFPRLDGSTSTVPLGRAIASRLLGETPDQVSDLLHFSRTTESFRKLMQGDCDLLISAEPAAGIWEEKEAAGFEWEMEPFGIDGLVFLVNRDNPVDSLTIDQIRGIYTGEITNWSQVGGEDLDIVPFQRNAEAGSQTAMLKLVMKDTPMMTPPSTCLIDSMFGLIEAVSSFDGSSAAIGYSVFYYANDMKMADGLKILKVEGVEPTDETLRSREYPLLLNYYVLIKAGLPGDDPAKQLFQWILSEEGQQLVAGQGYVSVLDVEPDPNGTMVLPPDSVWTLSEHYVGGSALAPLEDQTLLLPYQGSVQYDAEGIYAQNLYGICNERGELLTAPVYNGAYYVGGSLVLYRPTDAVLLPDISVYSDATVVAADGSWVKELGACQVDGTGLADTPIAVKYPDGTFTLCTQTMEPVLTVQGKDLEAFCGEGHFSECVWEKPNFGPHLWFGPGYAEVYERTAEGEEMFRLYVNLQDGTITEERPENCPELPLAGDPLPEVEGYQLFSRITDLVAETQYYYGRDIYTGHMVLLDAEGQPVWDGDDAVPVTVIGGMVAAKDYREPISYTWYDLDSGACIFRYYTITNDD